MSKGQGRRRPQDEDCSPLSDGCCQRPRLLVWLPVWMMILTILRQETGTPTSRSVPAELLVLLRSILAPLLAREAVRHTLTLQELLRRRLLRQQRRRCAVQKLARAELIRSLPLGLAITQDKHRRLRHPHRTTLRGQALVKESGGAALRLDIG